MVERLTCNEMVVSSNLTGGSTPGRVRISSLEVGFALKSFTPWPGLTAECGGAVMRPESDGAHLREPGAAAPASRLSAPATRAPASAAASLEAAIFPHLQPAAARRLLLSAHQVFARKGYAAATTREIAAGAGMSPAAMYIHYRSKQDLLFHLSLLGHEACEQVLLTAVATAGDPAAALAAGVAALAGWHAEHHTTARIVHYELGSLNRDNFDAVAAVRRRIDGVIRHAVERGVRSGDFQVDDVAGTTLVLTSMCVDVARWFPTGTLHAPSDVRRLYGQLGLRLVGR